VVERDRPRRELSEHDVEIGNARECHYGADSQAQRLFDRDGQRSKPMRQPFAERALRNPAEPQTRERDTELAGREEPRKHTCRPKRELRLRIPAASHCLEPRPSRAYERELRGNEEPVEQQEHDDGE